MVSREVSDAIPQTDPRAGYLVQRPAIDAAIARVLEGGLYILGGEVEVFEAADQGFVRGSSSKVLFDLDDLATFPVRCGLKWRAVAWRWVRSLY
jgi:hypothetical protein